MRRRLLAVVSLGLMLAAVIFTTALAHEERPAQYPPGIAGQTVPKYRTSGKALVVCTKATRGHVRKMKAGKLKSRNQALLKKCRYSQIMDAVQHARSGYRILVMPGRYSESHSRAVPVEDPKCANDRELASDGHHVPSYQYQLSCPRSKNLITIAGDRNGDRKCDTLCNLQIEGTGSTPSKVTIIGDKTKQNVIRADRADGFYLTNMKVLYGDINSVYVMETDGFALTKLVVAQARRYGILSFTSDPGLYDSINAYGNGHPGMPQHCAKWENNRIFANNADLFNAERIKYCNDTPYEKRDLSTTCPTFQTPVGTGAIIAGGNKDIVQNNQI